MTNQPKHFMILKIIGALAVAVAIVGVVFLIMGFGDFENHSKFITGMFMMPIGLFVAFPCLILGFRPQITKMQVETARYIQAENKETLKELADTGAEITSGAVTKTAAAVKRGLEDQIFCKHCGKQIDADSTFCSHCGEKQ